MSPAVWGGAGCRTEIGTQIHLTRGAVVNAGLSFSSASAGSGLDLESPHPVLLEALSWVDALTHTPLLPGLLRCTRVPMKSRKTAHSLQSCTLASQER